MKLKIFIFLSAFCLLSSALNAQYTKADTLAANAYDFWMAADTGNFEMVRLCVEKGMFVDVAYQDNITPLMLSVQAGHAEIVVYLIEKGANVNAVSLPDNIPVLTSAVVNNDIYLAEILIRSGAHIEAADQFGRLALHYAVIGKLPVMCDLLLYYESPVNQPDSMGFTPAYYAVVYGDTAVMKLLLPYLDENGKINDNGETLLFTAAKFNQFEIMKLLGKEGFRADQKSNDGINPIDECILNGNSEAVKWCLDNGAVLSDSITPYYNSRNLAIMSKNKDIKKMVRQTGIKASYRPYFSRLGFTFSIPFNSDDVFLGFSGDIYDTRYGLDIKAGFLIRPGSKAAWVEENPGVYLQLKEKRWGASIGIDKHFRLPSGYSFPVHLVLGVDQVISGGSYKSVERKTPVVFMLSPRVGLYIKISSDFGLQMMYGYYNLPNDNISPHRVSIGIRGSVNLRSHESDNRNYFIIRE